MILIQKAQFKPGQMVRHKVHGYRGLIFDVDPVYQPDDSMEDAPDEISVAYDRPWYHVLIEDADEASYVMQENLEISSDESAFLHPLLGSFFETGHQDAYGAYRARYSMN